MKAGRKGLSYKQSRNVQSTKDNHHSYKDQNSPIDTSILFKADSIIKNSDLRKVYRRRIVKICSGNYGGHDHAKGGGVLMYIHKSITFLEQNDLCPDSLEMVCLEIIKPHNN